MRIRQTVKKAVALGTGALMLGATILGASAANVSDYPTAFLKDGQVAAKIVVGQQAKAIDIVGAIDIAADLQAHAVSKESVTTTGTGVSVTNGKTKEITLGATIGNDFTTLTQADIPSLKDEKITWNDKDIDVEEKIYVDGVEVSASARDADFGAKVYLTTPTASAIKYEYIINDNDLVLANVDTTETLKVEILGKSIEITNVGNDEITMNVASEYFLAMGDSVTVDGKKITLKNVGSSGNVVVDVDGVVKTIANNADEKVNGIRIEVPDGNAFYDDEASQRSATLKIGDKITDTVGDTDSMELFGEPSTESDAEWVWHIDGNPATDNTTLTIGAYFNKRYDTDTEPVKAMGEKYTLPNNYASVYMASATAEANVDIDFAFEDGIAIDLLENGDTYADTLGEDLNALKITATKDIFSLDVNGENETASVVYLLETNVTATPVRVAYEDNDNKIRLASGSAAEAFWVDYEDTDLTVTYSNTSAGNAALKFDGDDLGTGVDFTLGANITAQRFGVTEADYESGVDVIFSAITVDKDNDYLTNGGVVISAVEDQLDNDKFQISIPSEQEKINVVVVGPSGSTSGSSGSVTTDKVNPVGVDFAVLDVDFTSGSQNSIIVGGPCVNTAAAKVMGNPSDCAAGFAQGEAMIATYADGSKVALLVAGYSGEDTYSATRALVTKTLPAKQSAKVVTTNTKEPSIQ